MGASTEVGRLQAKLDVHLHEEPIGTLAPAEGGYELTYARAVVDRAGEGATPLSRSLPVRAEPYGAESARPYFEGLLPDGMRRVRIASELGLDPGDSLGLLAALGRDCPGAVVVLPHGSEPPAPDPGSVVWADPAEAEELVEIPPPRLFDPGNEARMRFALPGERHRFAVVLDDANARWAWPQPGLPSTHILEPEDGEYPDFVVNRVACTAALREIGLPVAPLRLGTIAGNPCALAERFDRRGEGAAATRVHHETIWQALGFPPGAERRTEEAERPGFAHSADLLRELGGEAAVETLFKIGFAGFLLGNGAEEIVERRDLHGRHCALPLEGGREAPAATYHGIASTDVYASEEDVARTLPEWVKHTSGYAGLVRIGMECRFEQQRAVELGLDLANALGPGLRAVTDRAEEEGWYRPVLDEIVLVVTKRAMQLVEDLADTIRGPDGQTLREAGRFLR
jgi:serine/threonine-protein kinase HipA